MGIVCTSDDQRFMDQALRLARLAGERGEVPVGCVLVMNGQICGAGYNSSIMDCDPTAHAEVKALRDAANRVGNYRLSGSTLYVTLEPCAMCAGAILHARVARVVFAAWDERAGAAGSCLNLLQSPWMNHQCNIAGGVLKEQSRALLQAFFHSRR